MTQMRRPYGYLRSDLLPAHPSKTVQKQVEGYYESSSIYQLVTETDALYLYLGRVLQDIYIHTLVREDSNGFTTQVGDEVHPIGIRSLGAQLTDLLDVQVELTTYLQ